MFSFGCCLINTVNRTNVDYLRLALSNVVTQLAVRPLERMLTMVRDIAKTVFKMKSVVEEEEDPKAMCGNIGSPLKEIHGHLRNALVYLD